MSSGLAQSPSATRSVAGCSPESARRPGEPARVVEPRAGRGLSRCLRRRLRQIEVRGRHYPPNPPRCSAGAEPSWSSAGHAGPCRRLVRGSVCAPGSKTPSCRLTASRFRSSEVLHGDWIAVPHRRDLPGLLARRGDFALRLLGRRFRTEHACPGPHARSRCAHCHLLAGCSVLSRRDARDRVVATLLPGTMSRAGAWSCPFGHRRRLLDVRLLRVVRPARLFPSPAPDRAYGRLHQPLRTTAGDRRAPASIGTPASVAPADRCRIDTCTDPLLTARIEKSPPTAHWQPHRRPLSPPSYRTS